MYDRDPPLPGDELERLAQELQAVADRIDFADRLWVDRALTDVFGLVESVRRLVVGLGLWYSRAEWLLSVDPDHDAGAQRFVAEQQGRLQEMAARLRELEGSGEQLRQASARLELMEAVRIDDEDRADPLMAVELDEYYEVLVVDIARADEDVDSAWSRRGAAIVAARRLSDRVAVGREVHVTVVEEGTRHPEPLARCPGRSDHLLDA